jgi:hypothetical protein
MFVRVVLEDGREGDFDTSSVDFQEPEAFIGETVRIIGENGEEIEGVLSGRNQE